MTATEYAQSIEQTPTLFSWRELEKRAFVSHPDIEILMDTAAQALDSKKIPAFMTRLSCVGVLLFIPVQFAPIITAGILLGGSRVDGDPTTLLAWAGFFGVAHIVLSTRELVRAARHLEPAGAQQC